MLVLWTFWLNFYGLLERANLAVSFWLLLEMRGYVSGVLNRFGLPRCSRPSVPYSTSASERLVRVKFHIHEILMISHF